MDLNLEISKLEENEQRLFQIYKSICHQYWQYMGKAKWIEARASEILHQNNALNALKSFTEQQTLNLKF